MLTNKLYSVGSKVVILTFPAIISFIFILSYIFNFPIAKLFMGIMSIFSLLFGLCITVSSKQYKTSSKLYSGQILITKPEDGIKNFTLELYDDPDELEQKKTVTFKVLLKEPS